MVSSTQTAIAPPAREIAYGEPTPTIFELAAAYAFVFAKNHAFVDGNKRVAIETKATFLILNGYSLEVPEDEVVLMIRRLSTDQDLRNWYNHSLVGSWLGEGNKWLAG